MIENDLLRKECERLQITEKYYSSKYEGKEDFKNIENKIANVQEYNDILEELEWAKKSYFISYTLNIKLTQLTYGNNVNFNVDSLYEEVIEKGIPIKDWPNWISRTVMDKK